MIQNLKLKLSGELPVTRNELFQLVNSWGRTSNVYSLDLSTFEKCKGKQCYPLENLDVSQIDNMNEIFMYSPYNGNLSKWDVSNCTTMYSIFRESEFNNDSISNWNVSNVEDLNYAFSRTKFNGDLSGWNVGNCRDFKSVFSWSEFNNNSISNWDISNGIFFTYMFYGSKFDKILSNFSFDFKNENIFLEDIFLNSYNFLNKYNDGKELPKINKEILKWFEENREKIIEINTPKEEVLDFFSFESNLDKDIK